MTHGKLVFEYLEGLPSLRERKETREILIYAFWVILHLFVIFQSVSDIKLCLKLSHKLINSFLCKNGTLNVCQQPNFPGQRRII